MKHEQQSQLGSNRNQQNILNDLVQRFVFVRLLPQPREFVGNYFDGRNSRGD
jgi:hypothetical protein